MLPYVYDVHVEMLHPVRAKPGHRLVVRPGHPKRPVVVVQRAGDDWEPVRLGPPNYGALIAHEEAGVISQCHPVYASLAEHPAVQSA